MEVTEARQTDVFGPNGIEAGWTVIVTYTDAEMADLLANYDPASGTSPSVTYCRPTVRTILDAVKGATNAAG
jgi:hypothetical protein